MIIKIRGGKAISDKSLFDVWIEAQRTHDFGESLPGWMYEAGTTVVLDLLATVEERDNRIAELEGMLKAVGVSCAYQIGSAVIQGASRGQQP